MGFVREHTGIDLTGGGQRQAAGQAAQIQAEAGQEAIDVIRGDLAPFTGVGTEAANMLLQSVLQPDARQAAGEQVLSDPFFQALAQQQERDTLAQRAALGLAGSGGTQDILQQNLLQLGEGFRNNALQQQQARFNQLFNIAGLGQASAAQTGTQTAGLLTDIGAAQSTVPLVAGQVAAQQGQQLMQGLGGAQMAGMQAFGGGAAAGGGAGLAALFCDERLKENAVQVGADELGGIYEFNYIGDPQRYRGRMAQELIESRPDAVSRHDTGYLQVIEEFAPEAI